MRRILIPIFIGIVSFSFAQEVRDTSAAIQSELPTINLSTDEIDAEGFGRISNVSSLLQGSKDVFVNTAGYTFGAARFNMRGYRSNNQEVFMNGVQMNSVERGAVYWGVWGGLNDMMRNKTYSNGLNNHDFAFGGLAGATNISTRASKYRKNIGASYAISNKSYRNRLMLTYATGMMNNGWAFAASVSKRWAQEGYQEGTSYDAYSGFISVEKKINKKHSIGFTAFNSPSKRGSAGGSVQEAYDLTDNYYNPNWGYQNGEKRNAKITKSSKPHFMLTHYHKPTEKTTVTTSLSYAYGYYAKTALNWYKTRDPRPDYYRYLPSYYDDPSVQATVAETFKENHQLDWDGFYAANKNSEDGRALYIIEDRITDYDEASANMLINHKLTSQITIDGGFNYASYKGRHYTKVDDLLGADYYLDIDKFAERDFPNNPDMVDNDINKPNKVRHEGDIISHDYDMNQNKFSGWWQASVKTEKLDFFGGFNMSNTEFWRTGHMRNGKFQDNSFGESEHKYFFNYGFKAGATYKINGRNYIYAEGYYGTRAPLIQNSYISPRTRDFTVDGLTDEKITSIEGGYHLRAPRIKGRLTAYYTKFEDQTQVYSFYNDFHRSYTNQVLTGIDKENMGIELGVEGKINSSFTATAVAAIGQNIYSNRPSGIIIQDNNASQLADPSVIYQENFYQSGPQNAYSLSVKYTNPHYWFVSLSANFYQNNYLGFNPARRTVEAISNESGSDHVEEGSDLWHQIIDQEKLPNAFTLDLFARKTMRVKGHYMYLNVGINNILNNTDFATGGYEQRRFDYQNRDVDKFQPKYFYAYGINYFISIGVYI